MYETIKSHCVEHYVFPHSKYVSSYFLFRGRFLLGCWMRVCLWIPKSLLFIRHFPILNEKNNMIWLQFEYSSIYTTQKRYRMLSFDDFLFQHKTTITLSFVSLYSFAFIRFSLFSGLIWFNFFFLRFCVFKLYLKPPLDS